MNSVSEKNVHCLVHPGFDIWEHPKFEGNIIAYINDIASKTNDILLIVTDWERFDNEQLLQFARLDIIEAISLFLGLQDWWLGDLIPVFDSMWNYSPIIANNGLSESFYKWCEKNIDLNELHGIANEYRVLRNDYFWWKYKWNEELHDSQATNLRERELSAKMNLDIVSLSQKALDEFWPVAKRSMTYRNIENRGRFFRIFQHAMKVLWKERVREMFIIDGEKAPVVPIQPVTHFQVFEWDMIPTPFAANEEGIREHVFNASEEATYWNAAQLKDQITYELSVTRHEKLMKQQPKEVLEEMWVTVTSDTKFIFFWEYRNRCVNNVAHVLNYRISPITWDEFYIAWDALTLEKPC